MILVDTSVWIDFFRGHDLPHVQRLEEMIRQGEDLALCGVRNCSQFFTFL